MSFLFAYFLVGLLASIYVLLRYGCAPCSSVEAMWFIIVLLAAWPLVLGACYLIAIGQELRRIVDRLLY